MSGTDPIGGACREYRELWSHAGGAAAPERGHAAECSACAAWQRRLQRGLEALAGVPRLASPPQLEERVAGALRGEGRLARAIARVRELGRRPPPRELELAVEQRAGELAHGRRAPGVLERLVAEELADPGKARSRRFVGSLERFSAPALLAERLSASLATAFPPPRRRGVAWTALAAATLALLTWAVALRGGADEPRLRVVHPHSTQFLDPMARGWIDVVSGGVLAARDL